MHKVVRRREPHDEVVPRVAVQLHSIRTMEPSSESSPKFPFRVKRKLLMSCTLPVVAFVFCLISVPALHAQSEVPATQTMRPVLRGRHAAVASMKAEATEAARRILDAGGNAFDAAVAGQAALAVTDFPFNGVGSDAVILFYDAKAKRIVSLNAEPRAPKLATIEWYQKNNG